MSRNSGRDRTDEGKAAVDDRHASAELLDRYVSGGPGAALGPDEAWALEAHLELCGSCRARLADTVEVSAPEVTDLLALVEGRLDLHLPPAGSAGAGMASAGVMASPASVPTEQGGTRRTAPPAAAGPVRRPSRRRGRRWPLTRGAAPAATPWIIATVLLLGLATLFDALGESTAPGRPSLVLLLAPVVPLLGVAASWGRRMDPAYELVAASPRAGLQLVLRRTLGVLAVVLPVLVLAGLVSSASPARWMLPCLAFTACTLALGDVVGMTRAALGLFGLWLAGVLVPALANERMPAALQPSSLPGWVALAVLALLVLAARRNSFRHVLGTG
jgi:hypothetical protein